MNDIQALVIPSFLLMVPLSQDENCDWKKMMIMFLSCSCSLGLVREGTRLQCLPETQQASLVQIL